MQPLLVDPTIGSIQRIRSGTITFVGLKKLTIRLKGDASEIGIVRIEADPFFAISVTAAASVLGMRKSSNLFNAVVTNEIIILEVLLQLMNIFQHGKCR